jgi:hypothetical protein
VLTGADVAVLVPADPAEYSIGVCAACTCSSCGFQSVANKEVKAAVDAYLLEATERSCAAKYIAARDTLEANNITLSDGFYNQMMMVENISAVASAGRRRSYMEEFLQHARCQSETCAVYCTQGYIMAGCGDYSTDYLQTYCDCWIEVKPQCQASSRPHRTLHGQGQGWYTQAYNAQKKAEEDKDKAEIVRYEMEGHVDDVSQNLSNSSAGDWSSYGHKSVLESPIGMRGHDHQIRLPKKHGLYAIAYMLYPCTLTRDVEIAVDDNGYWTKGGWHYYVQHGLT